MNNESKKVKALLFGLCLSIVMGVSMYARNDRIKDMVNGKLSKCTETLDATSQYLNEVEWTLKQCLFLYQRGAEECVKI